MTEREGLGFSHPEIQRLRRLVGRRSSREDEGAFVVEGPVLIAMALIAGWTVDAQYAAPGVDPVDGGGPVHRLARGVAERVSDTQTSTGLLAVVARPERPPDLLAGAGFVLVADRLADPGNLGTMLRSAEAAGVDAVALTDGSVDVYNPKVVRSSAGALFQMPVTTVPSIDAVAHYGLRLVGTSSHRGVPHTDADWSGRLAIVAGGEAQGLADDAPVDDWVRIHHHGRTESLNVAMAVTVLCFEAARARHGGRNR